MSVWWFPDNTVLCNFAVVHRLDVLEKVLDSRGRWTEAVAYETHRSARHLPDLRVVEADGWLGDPVEVADPAEVQGVERLRRAVFGGIRARPLQHLGEAQTCYLIEHRREFRGSVWITDDGEAFRYARRRGITAHQTMDLVRMAVAAGVLTAAEGFALLHAMVAAGRHLHRLPTAPGELRG